MFYIRAGKIRSIGPYPQRGQNPFCSNLKSEKESVKGKMRNFGKMSSFW